MILDVARLDIRSGLSENFHLQLKLLYARLKCIYCHQIEFKLEHLRQQISIEMFDRDLSQKIAIVSP